MEDAQLQIIKYLDHIVHDSVSVQVGTTGLLTTRVARVAQQQVDRLVQASSRFRRDPMDVGGAGGAGGLPSDIVAVLDIIEPHLHHLHGMPGRGEGSEDGSEYAEEGDMNSAPAHFNNAF